jgi:hypothetical protein
MSVIVDVRPRYVRSARDLARARNESYKQRESYQRRLEELDRHPEIDNIIGAVGEFAFSEHAGLQIDSDISSTGDGGIDFRAQIGGEKVTVDMKTRTGDLFTFWVKEDSLGADYYVLGHLTAPIDFDETTLDEIDTLEGWTVELIGTATKDEFLEARRIDSDFGYVNRSILLEDLHPVPSSDDIVEYD